MTIRDFKKETSAAIIVTFSDRNIVSLYPKTGAYGVMDLTTREARSLAAMLTKACDKRAEWKKRKGEASR